jgi:hypothetical protein
MPSRTTCGTSIASDVRDWRIIVGGSFAGLGVGGG